MTLTLTLTLYMQYEYSPVQYKPYNAFYVACLTVPKLRTLMNFLKLFMHPLPLERCWRRSVYGLFICACI